MGITTAPYRRAPRVCVYIVQLYALKAAAAAAAESVSTISSVHTQQKMDLYCHGTPILYRLHLSSTSPPLVCSLKEREGERATFGVQETSAGKRGKYTRERERDVENFGVDLLLLFVYPHPVCL